MRSLSPRFLTLAALCLSVGLAWAAAAPTAALTAASEPAASTTLHPTTDTYVNQASPSANYSGATILGAGRSEFLEESYALVLFNLTVAALLPGLHTLTLTATDGDGMTAAASVTITIGRRLWLPLVLR